MASMLVNMFGLREDVEAYHLGGMGCSMGVVGLNLVRDLLAVRSHGACGARMACACACMGRACARGALACACRVRARLWALLQPAEALMQP